MQQGYLDPPINMMRYQGKPALAIQLANVAGGNLVKTGEALDARLEELLADLPAGIEVEKFTWQSDLVRESIDGFVVNLAEAVLIVLAVLTLAMGWRMGLIIGWALIVTILGTFIVMKVMGIDLHRVSLGALVVALGMMVDNAIVVADNTKVRLARDMDAVEAAIESAAKPGVALLGATVVAGMAFYPVYAAKADAGEYGRTLFVVVFVSLVISWLLSMTMTPLNCISLLKPSARGMDVVEAAIESAAKPGVALLGATVVAGMAFYPVYAAKADAGEYGRTLFVVVFVSLVISWLLSMTMTPLNCISLLKPPKEESDTGADPYGGGFFRVYRRLLEAALRYRLLTIGGATVLLVWAGVGFVKDVPKQFFPDSTRAQFMVDYWAPQGTPIQSVSADLRGIEAKLLPDPRVKGVGTFIGSGGPRFYLPVDPELPYQSFGQLIVNTLTFDDVNSLVAELEPWLNEHYPQALTRVRKYTVGPGDTWPFELRISGPANADLDTLRRLGEEGMAILKESPHAKHVRTDMRQRTQKVVVDYDQERARWSAVSRSNLAQATQRVYDGTPVGLYRAGDSLLPIIARNVDSERQRAPAELDVVQVKPTLTTKTLPLGQVVQDIRLEWEDPIITRWNRRRQIAVQAQPEGVFFPTLRESVIEKFEAMELPPGYEMFWDGEYDSTLRSQRALLPGMAPAAVIMVLIIVALFNAVRPPIVMALTVPFALIGITAILAPTKIPFGFMALLGAMSLVGLMIRTMIHGAAARV